MSAAAATDGSTPVADLPGMNPLRARALERLGLRTAEDLLTHFPRRYEDRREFAHFPTTASEQPVCVCGLVVAAASKRLRGRNTLFEATLQETAGHALSGRLTLRWFGLYYIHKIIATASAWSFSASRNPRARRFSSIIRILKCSKKAAGTKR